LQKGEVVGLYIAAQGQRPKEGLRRAAMNPVDYVLAVAGFGLMGDRYYLNRLLGSYSKTARIPDIFRQVTFMGMEDFEAGVLEMSGRMDIRETRRNIITRGIDYRELKKKTIRIVSDSRTRRFAGFLTEEECTPCNIPDDGKLGFKEAFGSEWRGGVRAQVTKTGLVEMGYQVLVMDRKPGIITDAQQ